MYLISLIRFLYIELVYKYLFLFCFIEIYFIER